NQPMPASCDAAKAVFLGKLAVHMKTMPVKPPMRRWHALRPARLAAVAAMLLIALSILTWAVWPPESRASEVVDRLVDFNTELSKADFGRRKQLLEAKEADLRKRLQEARLSKEERASGDQLLAGAVSLASSDDLEEDEAILTALADNLRDRAKTAQAKGSDQ